MNICANPECSAEAKNKYCSKSCAAKINNLGRTRNPITVQRLSECMGCSKPLSSYQFKWCSNKCQQQTARRIKVDEWLRTGLANAGSHAGHYVRDYIIEEQNGLCAICSMSGIWNEKPISFILDHIDGNSGNNRRENLRLVCPNCDSQLETYKSKNKGNGRHKRRERYEAGLSY